MRNSSSPPSVVYNCFIHFFTMSDKEDDDRSPRSTPPKKIPKKGGWTRKKEGNTSSQHRSQNFRQQWLKDPAFKDWLLPDTNDTTKAKCAFCPGTSMVAELSNLNKPGSSGKTQSQSLTSLGFQKGITPQNKEKVVQKLNLLHFLRNITLRSQWLII